MSEKRKDLKSVASVTISNYLRRSAISGVSHAANSESYFRGVYWLIIFLTLFSFTARNVYIIMNDYYDFPIFTVATIKRKEEIPFPAVTICNQNR